MKNIIFLIISALAFTSCHIAETENPTGNITVMPVIRAYTSGENFSFLLENKTNDVSIPAQFIFNNKPYKSIIKAQGAGSRYYPKWNYFVELEEGGKINGLSSFNLSAQAVDPTFIRTPLSLHLYNQLGFFTFIAEPYFFTINDAQYGLYLLIEKIDEKYFASRSIPVAELVKASFGAQFTFSTKNDLSDHFEKKIPDDGNYNNLAGFIHALDTVKTADLFSSISKYLNIRQCLRYQAFNIIVNNSDALTNNFYFYKKTPSSPYEIIPWDFDKSFDYKINLELYGDNDIIKTLMKSDTCRSIYLEEMSDILKKYFTEENLFPVIDKYYNIIKEVYTLDPWLKSNGYSLAQEVENLKKMISSRREYLLGLLNKGL
jgi:spore coat protein CotH